MKLRTRMLALFLTLLMVAGMLPMSIFAIDAKAGGNVVDEHTGKDWSGANAIKETLDEHFQIDYETTIGSVVTAAHNGGKTPTYTEGKGYVLEKGANNYVDFRMTGYNGGSTVIPKLGDKGGRDFVISFDFALLEDADLSSLTGNLYNMMAINFRKSDNVDTSIGGFAVNRGNMDLFGIDNKSVWTPGAVARLKKGENIKFYFYFDFGGPRNDCGNTAYYLAYDKDGVLLGFQQFTVLADSTIGVVYDETAKEGYTQQGFVLTHVRFNNNNANYGMQVDNLQVHYSKNTKSEKNFIDLETRSMGLYYDFDDLTVGNYYNGGSQTAAKYFGQTGLNMANNHANANGFLAVSDGNGGASLQLNPKASVSDRYVNVGSPFAAGKKFSFSVDVKSGPKMAGANLIQFLDRDSNNLYQNYATAAWYTNLDAATQAKVAATIGTGNKSMVGNGVVWVAADKTIGYNYYASETTTTTTKSPAVAKLNDEVFTNIELVYDGATNLCWMYVNGVLVSPEAGFMALDPAWSAVLKLSHGGTKAGEFRLYQTSHTGNAITFDNIAMYHINKNGERLTNKLPLEGVKKDADGFVRYYDNGYVVANYTSADGAWATDEGGVIYRKDRYSFIDWEATAAGGEEKEIVTYSKMGGTGVKAYADALFGSSLASQMKLHYNNHLTRGTGNVLFTLDKTSSAFREVTYDTCDPVGKNWGKVGTNTAKLINLNDFDELQLDMYTDQVYQYLTYVRFECPQDLYGRASNYTPNYQHGYNFGTTGYYPNGKDKGGTQRNYTDMGPGLEVDGWASVTFDLDTLTPAREYRVNGEDISRQYIENFYFYNNGWGCLDGKQDANGDYMYNHTESPIFFKDIYLVKHVRLTEIAQVEALYEQLGNGDFVPKDFTGKFTAESGNEYFYNVYDHKRVVNKDYFDTEMSGDTVTGYSADEYGVLTPVTGKFVNRQATVTFNTNRKFSRRATLIYVNGVIQKGTPENDYSVVYNGARYSVNGDGHVQGTYVGVPASPLKSTDVAGYVSDANLIKGENFNSLAGGTCYRNFFLSDEVALAGYKYASNSATANTIFVQNNGPAKTATQKDIALQFKYFGNGANPYFNSGGFTGDTVLEFDFMIEDDWNASLQTYTRDGGAVWSFYVKPDGTLTMDGVNQPVAKLVPGEWAKIAVASHITPNGSKFKYTYDVYFNGLLVATSEATSQNDKGDGTLDFWRCFAFQGNDDANTGTYNVDNWWHYKGTAPVGITSNYTGYAGNAYYENGVKVSAKLITTDEGYLYAWSNGTLAYDSAFKVDGQWYVFDGYLGKKVESDGVHAGFAFANGELVTTVGLVKAGNNVYYVNNTTGTVSSNTTIEVDNVRYTLAEGDGHVVKAETLTVSSVLQDMVTNSANVTYNVNDFGADSQYLLGSTPVHNGLAIKDQSSYLDLSGYNYLFFDVHTAAQTTEGANMKIGLVFGHAERWYPVNGVTGTVNADGNKFTDAHGTSAITYDPKVYVYSNSGMKEMLDKDGKKIQNVSITTAEGINVGDGRLWYNPTTQQFYVRTWRYANSAYTYTNTNGSYAEAMTQTVKYNLSGAKDYLKNISRFQICHGGWDYGFKSGWTGGVNYSNIKIAKFDNVYTDLATIEKLAVGELKGGWVGTAGAAGSKYADPITHVLVTGVQVIDGIFYGFDADGVCQGALQNINATANVTGTTVGTANRGFIDGVMVSGLAKLPDGKWVYADVNGVLTENATKTTLNVPYYDVDTTVANRVVNITNFEVTFVEEFDLADELYYIHGIAQGAGLYIDGDGNYYYVGTDNKVQKEGAVVVNGVTYDIYDYLAYPRHDGINNGKFFWNGEAQTGIIDKTRFPESVFLGEGEIVFADAEGNAYKEGIIYVEGDGYNCWYVFEAYKGVKAEGMSTFDYTDDDLGETVRIFVGGALQSGVVSYGGKTYVTDANGNLLKGQQTAVDGKTYDCDATTYEATVRNGIIADQKDGNVDKYYVDGVAQTGFFEIGGKCYYALGNGELCVGQIVTNGGKTYDFDANTYEGTIRNGIIADQFDNNAKKYYVDGRYQTGLFAEGGNTYIADEYGRLLVGQQVANDGKTYDCDATTYVATVRNGIIADQFDNNAKKYYVDGVAKNGFFEINGKLYLTDNADRLLTGKQTVSQDADRVYDFDATTFEGTKRDNYAVIEELYWLDGYTADGVHYVNGEEMYFVEGDPTAAEIPFEDGTIHVFGEDGKRVVEAGADAPEDKPAHAITVTLQLKNADGTYTKIGYREFYHYWNTDFAYVAPYNSCYVVSIELKQGDNVTVYGDTVEIANVQANYDIIVTYDTTVEKAHEYELVDVDAATCVEGGVEYYVCVCCGAEKTEATEVEPDAHNYVADITPATCIANGKYVYTCEHCEDSFTVYTAKVSHNWVRDAENDVEATCGKAGKTAYKCAEEGCTATKKVTVAATGEHNFSGKLEVKTPTCCNTGYVKEGCVDCPATQTTVLPATGIHTYDESDTPNEILTNAANGDKTYLYNCAECGKIGAVTVVVPATPVVPAPGGDDDNLELV